MSSNPWRHVAAPALLLVVVALSFLPGLGGSFIFDDYAHIVHQADVHMTSIDAESVERALMSFRHGVGRPLPMLSFALDHLVWGKAPFGYKLSSLAVHLVNALLVFALLLQVFRIPQAGVRASGWIAAAAALLWAVHPLQVSTVFYVVQRMEMLALLFTLLALLAYVGGRVRQMQGRRAWPLLAACLPLLALGLACKETAVLFPAYALTLELTVLGFRASDARTSSRWKLAHAVWVVAAVILVLVLAPLFVGEETYAIRPYSAFERVLTQLRVVPMYLGWILLPNPSSYVFYYDQYEASRGLLEPASTLFGGLLLLGLLASALWARKKAPLYSLGVLLFLSAHLVTSSYLPLELVFEHRNYFAILGVVLAVFGLAGLLPAKAEARTLALVTCLGIAGLATITAIRSASWGNPLHLAMELAQRNPASTRAGTQLADTYALMAGADDSDVFHSLAEAEYERVSLLPRSSPIPEQGLIILAAKQGKPAKPEWWERILHKLRTQPIGPQEMSVVTSLLDFRVGGMALDDRQLSEAYVILSTRMALPPSQYFAFGMHALTRLEDRILARQLFSLALEHGGSDPRFAAELSSYLDEQGFPEEASWLRAQAATYQSTTR